MRQRHLKFVRPAAVAALFLATAGWVRPQVPSTAKPAAAYGQKLDYVVVLVNGQPRIVKDGGELAVVRGDTLLVKEAALRSRSASVRDVNVIGFAPPGARPGEDRGFAFATTQLKAKYSEGGKGDLFAVVATSKGTLHGVVYLRVIEPVLRYAEISLNGQKHVLRDGEPLTVRATDQVKVERVVTNLESTGDVLFQISDEAPQGGYAIRFLRAGAAFASIPLKVVE